MSCSAARNCQHLRNDRGTGRLAEALPRVRATVGGTSDTEGNSTLRRNRRERRRKNHPIGIATFYSIETSLHALADATLWRCALGSVSETRDEPRQFGRRQRVIEINGERCLVDA